MQIEIVNLRYEKPSKPYDVRVCRPSILGNPFVMKHGVEEHKRNEVCDRYEEYFHNQLSDNKMFQEEVAHIVQLLQYFGQVRLFCWCAPKRCHAETIVDFIMKGVPNEDSGNRLPS